MRCKSCHYSLDNLAEHRCPECGRAFDPADPATFDADDWQRRRDLHLFVWMGGGFMLISGAYILISWVGLRLGWEFELPHFNVSIGALVVLAASFWFFFLRKR